VGAAASLSLQSKQYSSGRRRASGRTQPRLRNGTFGDRSFCRRLAAGVRAGLTLPRRNCGRLWRSPSWRSPHGSLRRAVAVRERAGGPRHGRRAAGRSGARKGLAHELGAFLLGAFILWMWDLGALCFFWQLSPRSPGADQSPALSLWPDTRRVSGRQELFQEVSDRLP